jgi:hypothetical protein
VLRGVGRGDHEAVGGDAELVGQACGDLGDAAVGAARGRVGGHVADDVHDGDDDGVLAVADRGGADLDGVGLVDAVGPAHVERDEAAVGRERGVELLGGLAAALVGLLPALGRRDEAAHRGARAEPAVGQPLTGRDGRALRRRRRRRRRVGRGRRASGCRALDVPAQDVPDLDVPDLGVAVEHRRERRVEIGRGRPRRGRLRQRRPGPGGAEAERADEEAGEDGAEHGAHGRHPFG